MNSFVSSSVLASFALENSFKSVQCLVILILCAKYRTIYLKVFPPIELFRCSSLWLDLLSFHVQMVLFSLAQSQLRRLVTVYSDGFVKFPYDDGIPASTSAH